MEEGHADKLAAALQASNAYGQLNVQLANILMRLVVQCLARYEQDCEKRTFRRAQRHIQELTAALQAATETSQKTAQLFTTWAAREASDKALVAQRLADLELRDLVTTHFQEQWWVRHCLAVAPDGEE